jgi:hypothetical protein
LAGGLRGPKVVSDLHAQSIAVHRGRLEPALTSRRIGLHAASEGLRQRCAILRRMGLLQGVVTTDPGGFVPDEDVTMTSPYLREFREDVVEVVVLVTTQYGLTDPRKHSGSRRPASDQQKDTRPVSGRVSSRWT